jgi:CMP-N,N'-diacetyllegionaminic acid synthase
MSSAASPSVALILARAGSKGVPGKNIAPIAGKPCVAWTIEYALGSVGRVAVSTDDARIVDLVRSKYPRVNCVARPAELASDTARVDDAARHAIGELEKTWPELKKPEAAVVILYANVPVRPRGLIELALAAMAGADSVQSYQPVGKNHPWWTARIDPDSKEVRAWEGDELNHGVYRRQDLPPAFVPDGGVLAVTRRALFLEVAGAAAGPHAFFGNVRRGIVSPGPVVDIDTRIDALVADAMLRPPETTVRP